VTNTGNNPFVDRDGEMEISLEQMLSALLRHEAISCVPEYHSGILILSRYIQGDPSNSEYWTALGVLCKLIVFDIDIEFTRLDFEITAAHIRFKFEWADPSNTWRQGKIKFLFYLGTDEARVSWSATGKSLKGMAKIITGREAANAD
jgi:hypothetical protein